MHEPSVRVRLRRLRFLSPHSRRLPWEFENCLFSLTPPELGATDPKEDLDTKESMNNADLSLPSKKGAIALKD